MANNCLFAVAAENCADLLVYPCRKISTTIKNFSEFLKVLSNSLISCSWFVKHFLPKTDRKTSKIVAFWWIFSFLLVVDELKCGSLWGCLKNSFISLPPSEWSVTSHVIELHFNHCSHYETSFKMTVMKSSLITIIMKILADLIYIFFWIFNQSPFIFVYLQSHSGVHRLQRVQIHVASGLVTPFALGVSAWKTCRRGIGFALCGNILETLNIFQFYWLRLSFLGRAGMPRLCTITGWSVTRNQVSVCIFLSKSYSCMYVKIYQAWQVKYCQISKHSGTYRIDLKGHKFRYLFLCLLVVLEFCL